MVERIASIYQHNLGAGGSDLRHALEQCVEKLVGRARKIIQLHYWQDMKSWQIASELNIGHGAVRMLLSRSRQALRSCIEQQLGRSLEVQ
jgi:RNA polymerase sigma factor (sigma-70 family)